MQGKFYGIADVAEELDLHILEDLILEGAAGNEITKAIKAPHLFDLLSAQLVHPHDKLFSECIEPWLA